MNSEAMYAAKPLTRAYGVVKMFNAEKGYGFISVENGSDVFVHISAAQQSGIPSLFTGMRVSFDYKKNDKGDVAVNLALDDRTAAHNVVFTDRHGVRWNGKGQRVIFADVTEINECLLSWMRSEVVNKLKREKEHAEAFFRAVKPVTIPEVAKGTTLHSFTELAAALQVQS